MVSIKFQINKTTESNIGLSTLFRLKFVKKKNIKNAELRKANYHAPEKG